MNRRQVYLIVMLVLLLFCLTACSGAETAEPVTDSGMSADMSFLPDSALKPDLPPCEALQELLKGGEEDPTGETTEETRKSEEDIDLAGSPFSEAEIDYGKSSVYTKEDMDSAITAIGDWISRSSVWSACEWHSISYSSDSQCNTSEKIAWMNELEKVNNPKHLFTKCIMFTSDFRSPKEDCGTLNPDSEYTDWHWWLARYDKDEWKVMDCGY